MGNDFIAYLLHGDPNNFQGAGWGGSFVPLHHSSHRIFDQSTTLADTVPTFSVLEWVFKGPIYDETFKQPPFWIEISNQQFEGEYEGKGLYKVKFVAKSSGHWEYTTISALRELDGHTGQFVSVDPWPGELHKQDIVPLNHWWSDDPKPENFEGGHQGAKTIFKWQTDFLEDWAKRWAWLEEK